VFDNPRPTLAELVKFYSRPSQYDSWLNELDLRDAMWKRRLKLILPFREQGSLLDIGAGIGQFLALARPYYEQVYGTEVSTTAVQIAKQKYGLELFQGTLEQFASGGRVFDNLSMIHVLEHVPDPLAVIRICHSLLSEGGVLVIAVPNEVACLRGKLKRSLVSAGILKPRLSAGKFGLEPIRLTEQTAEVHLSHFTPSVLEGLLRRSGFEVIKNTPDPHYVRNTKIKKLRADVYFNFCVGVEKLSGVNPYDTMLVIARKSHPEQPILA
jgi:2-polyprenyl-3-methyl-5-hydroxy-6-metoxy-1,4-benzoquinol methylase